MFGIGKKIISSATKSATQKVVQNKAVEELKIATKKALQDNVQELDTFIKIQLPKTTAAQKSAVTDLEHLAQSVKNIK